MTLLLCENSQNPTKQTTLELFFCVCSIFGLFESGYSLRKTKTNRKGDEKLNQEIQPASRATVLGLVLNDLVEALLTIQSA